MERLFFILASVSGFLCVALGAFAAHALKSRLESDLLDVFEVGVRYQMYHTFALFASAWAISKWPGTWTMASGWLFLAGILVFSGSLYVLSLTGVRWLGAITPLGGFFFLAGWVALVVGALKSS